MGIFSSLGLMLRPRPKFDYERAAEALDRSAAINRFLPGFPALSFYLANLSVKNLYDLGDMLGRVIDAEIDTDTPVRKILVEVSGTQDGWPPQEVMADFAKMTNEDLDCLSEVFEQLVMLSDMAG